MSGKQVVLFGYGKVGKEACRLLTESSAKITVVELYKDLNLPAGVEYIAGNDLKRVLSKVKDADFVIKATGLSEIIQKVYQVNAFLDSNAVLISIGAVDECGSEFPEDSVLNKKSPYNFVLDKSTHMRFIDPIFALFNQCAALLVHRNYMLRIHQLSEALVNQSVRRFCQTHIYTHRLSNCYVVVSVRSPRLPTICRLTGLRSLAA